MSFMPRAPAMVWQALTDPAHLSEWAPFDADRNLAAVGPVKLSTVRTPTPQVFESTVKRVAFPRWGPVAGYRPGLVLNSDPVVTLFKPGHRYVVLNNAFPVGARDTDRVHPFWQNGQTFTMNAMGSDHPEWPKQLYRAAIFGSPQISRELLLRFGESYLARLRRVRSEVEKVPERLRASATGPISNTRYEIGRASCRERV